MTSIFPAAGRMTALISIAFSLAACGGGNGAVSPAMPTPEMPAPALEQVTMDRERYDPTVENAERVNMLAAYPSQKPTKVFAAESEPLRVGSLVREGYEIVLGTQLQGKWFQFLLYDTDGNLVDYGDIARRSCTGGTCPEDGDAYNRISDETGRRLQQQGKFSNDLNDPGFTGTTTAEEYADVFGQVAASMGYTGTFTHHDAKFGRYQVPNSDEATGRAVDLVAADGPREGQDRWDLGLLGEATGLEYTDFGIWAYRGARGADPGDDAPADGGCGTEAVLCLIGPHVFGAETPADLIPTAGSATYDGKTAGFVGPSAGAFDPSNVYAIGGDIQVGVDFADGSVTAETSGMQLTRGTEIESAPWYDIRFTGRLDGDNRSRYGASDVAVTAPGSAVRSDGDIGTSPTGGLEGVFYGPSGNSGPRETGGTWHLSDGDTVAVGSFGAKQEQE